MEKKSIPRGVRISQEHNEWIKKNCINLSALIRGFLDKKIKGEAV